MASTTLELHVSIRSGFSCSRALHSSIAREFEHSGAMAWGTADGRPTAAMADPAMGLTADERTASQREYHAPWRNKRRCKSRGLWHCVVQVS